MADVPFTLVIHCHAHRADLQGHLRRHYIGLEVILEVVFTNHGTWLQLYSRLQKSHIVLALPSMTAGSKSFHHGA
jgi:hypothetical protein